MDKERSESIVQWRKEYVEDLLNPNNTHSEEKEGPEDLGSFVTGVEVATFVKPLRSGSTMGEDEIHPKLLKALDVVGVS